MRRKGFKEVRRDRKGEANKVGRGIEIRGIVSESLNIVVEVEKDSEVNKID